MAIVGIFTNVGVLKSRQAANDEGFYIFPVSFGVSHTRGTLDGSRTSANAGLWFQAAISSRVVVSDNTVKFICTVPPGALPPAATDFVREIYIFGQDSQSNDFLYAIGQPTTDILYEPTSSTTFELEISLTNADLTAQVLFSFTQATELAEHETDPNAHAEIIQAINRAGLFLKAGGVPFTYAGQNFDEKAEFDGVQATATVGSLLFQAIHTGTQGNPISLVFDGVLTTDQVVLAWNNAHPDNRVQHNGSGLEVLLPQTVTLTGGSLNVNAFSLVYRDTDGFYKMGLADGTIKQRVVGIADIGNRIVRSGGFLAYASGFAVGTELYLSPSVLGAFTNVPSEVKVALVTAPDTILLSSFGGGSGGAAQTFDAIVTDTPGFKKYTTTQEAISSVSDGASILIDKEESIATQIDSQGKQITFVFNGPRTGWHKFLGQVEAIRINFSSTPTSGTWRIEWNSQETTDLNYNATALEVQNAFNALSGHSGVTVSGSYSTGYVITFAGFSSYSLPTFNDLGANEVQKITLSDTPDDGTIQFQFNGDTTIHIPWNTSTQDFEFYLEALSTINDVSVTGSWVQKYFHIEFKNADGLRNQPAITIIDNSLSKNGTPVGAVPSTLVEGKFPSNNLRAGVLPLAITPQLLQGGLPIGPSTVFQVGKDRTRFLGHGIIKDFLTGIDLAGYKDVDIEVEFQNVNSPVAGAASGLYPEIDYHVQNSFGLARRRTFYVGDSVGHPSDFNDLLSAYLASQDGDKIVVLNDQSIGSNTVFSKAVEIEFVANAKVTVFGPISGAVLSLANGIRTKNLHLAISDPGSYDTALLFQGEMGHHENLLLECSGNGVSLMNAFLVDSNADAIFVDGILMIGTATVTNKLGNNSGLASHNVVIRDRDNGIVYDLFNRRPPKQETPTGTVDGVNPFFTLSEVPASDDSVIVMVDNIPRKKGSHWTISGNTVTFLTGSIPQLGQDVYVYYLPNGLISSPPTAKAGAIEGQYTLNSVDNTIVQATRRIAFGQQFEVSQDNVDSFQLRVSLNFRVEPRTISALEAFNKQLTLGFNPKIKETVLCFLTGSSLQTYGVDFEINDPNVVSWDSLGLDGIITNGTKLFFIYFSN